MKSTIAVRNNLLGSIPMGSMAQHPAEMYMPALHRGFILPIKLGGSVTEMTPVLLYMSIYEPKTHSQHTLSAIGPFLL